MAVLPPITPMPITAWSAVNCLGTTKKQIQDALWAERSGLAINTTVPFVTLSGDAPSDLPALPARLSDFDSRQSRIALAAFDGIAGQVAAATRRWGVGLTSLFATEYAG